MFDIPGGAFGTVLHHATNQFFKGPHMGAKIQALEHEGQMGLEVRLDVTNEERASEWIRNAFENHALSGLEACNLKF